MNEDSQAPDTYKIICSSDVKKESLNSSNTVFEIIKVEEKPQTRQTRKSAAKIKKEEMESDDRFTAMDEDTLKLRVAELLKIVVDEDVLTKYGYPKETVENVLSNVLIECEQTPADYNSCPDTGSKIRENVKLLFTTVIDDESIKSMLNNNTVDEVINHVIDLANA